MRSTNENTQQEFSPAAGMFFYLIELLLTLTVLMKSFKTIILITTILVAACAFNVAAQHKAEKTSSARAAYGPASHKPKFKKSKKKKVKGNGHTHKRPAKGTRADAWSVRRKFTRL